MSCLGVRIGVAAVIGYSLGAIATGDATVAWGAAAAAALGMYLWTRVVSGRVGQACATGCAMPRSGRRGRVGRTQDAPDGEAPGDASPATTGHGAADEDGTAVPGVRELAARRPAD